MSNLRTLIGALQNEQPYEIFDNFKKYISRNETIQNSKNFKGILLQCETSRVYSYKIHLAGWCLCKSNVKSIRIFVNDEFLGFADYGISSHEIGNAFPDIKNSNNARFNCSFWGNFSEEDLIKIVAEDTEGEIVELVVDKFTNTEQKDYNTFLKLNDLSPFQVSKITRSVSGMKNRPGFSFVVDLNGVDKFGLTKFIASLQAQYYSQWEVIFYLPRSKRTLFQDILDKHKTDNKIKVFSGNDKNIPNAINFLMSKRSYNHVIHVNPNTILSRVCLYQAAQKVEDISDFEIIYADEDFLDKDLNKSNPHFKSDFNHDMLLSTNYIGHFVILVNLEDGENDLFDEEFEKAYLYHFLLINMHETKFNHIPQVLIHNLENQTPIENQQENKKALESYLHLNEIKGTVTDGMIEGTFRIKREIETFKKVSIVIPFKDEIEMLENCLKSIESKTKYPNYEIILVNNNSQDPITFKKLKALEKSKHISVFEYNIPFNYSQINNWAVDKTSGEYVLFLNNDIEVIADEWMTTMVAHLQRNEVGAVGAKLLFPDNSVQHAGVVLKIGGLAAHVFKFFPDSHPGYFGRTSITQNLTACTAACLMVKKDLFLKTGGFDAENLTVEFNDIDLCLKIRQENKLIVYTPFAKLYHFESKSRGDNTTAEKMERNEREADYFIAKWKNHLELGDPFYNKNLTLRYYDFSLNL